MDFNRMWYSIGDFIALSRNHFETADIAMHGKQWVKRQ